jgi:PAS domain S-box-containing protein
MSSEALYIGSDSNDPMKMPFEEEPGTLYHSEQTYSLLVSSVKDYAIFMLDPNGMISTWNEGAQRIKGYSAREIIGRHFSTFYTLEDKQRRHPEHELKIALAEGRYEEEGWRVRKDGTKFWANVVITRILDESGTLVGFGKVTRDLTERRQVELEREQAAEALTAKNKELEESSRQLALSNDELQRLAYIISHELQAPIATISRYCNLLSVRYRDRLGEDANDFMAKMGTASSLIARMIDDLWTYARITKPGLEISELSIRHVVNDAILQLKGRVEPDSLIIGELPSCEGNRPQLTFVFKELILNAVRYKSAAALRIEIKCTEHDDGWVFSVKDNGIGIDRIYAPEVFQIFHRLKSGPEASATGMGLATCKKIIEHHQGSIWYESEGEGHGTTFYFRLPKRHKR